MLFITGLFSSLSSKEMQKWFPNIQPETINKSIKRKTNTQ